MRQTNKERLSEFVNRLRELSEINGLGQIDIARKLSLPPSRVGNWFQGKYFPKPNERGRLAEMLGVSISFLLHGCEKNIHEYSKGEEDTSHSVEEEKSGYHNIFKHFIEDLPLNELVYKLDEIISDEKQTAKTRIEGCKVFLNEIKKRLKEPT